MSFLRRYSSVVPSLFLALALATSNAHAATFTVDSTADAVDATLGDGICATATGTCTLRAAVQEANHYAGNDIVSLPAGTYTLTIAGTGEDEAATGDLDIRTEDFLPGDLASGGVEIAGAGAESTIIDGNQLDNVIDIISSYVYTAGFVHDVTIRNGFTGIQGAGTGVVVHDTHVADNSGAGISVAASNSAVEVKRCTVTGNGGGITAIGFSSSITDTTISNNRSTGLSVMASGPGMTIHDVVISDNVSPSCGGMSVSWGGNQGPPSLGGITLTRNKATVGNGGGACIDINGQAISGIVSATGNEAAGDGGAIWARTPFTFLGIGGSILSDNVAGGNGGAIFVDAGGVDFSGSRLEGNHAGANGGAIDARGTASTLPRVELVGIQASVTDNTAGGDGGGISAPNGLPIRLENSTISGNEAAGDGGGIATASGQSPVTVRLEHVTIVKNEAGGTGGGIHIFHPFPPPGPHLTFGRGLVSELPSFRVNDSIIAANTAADGADCSTNVIMTGSAHNLVEDTDGCLVPIDAGSVYGSDPGLAPLANEGGLTLVHRLLPTSPALDAANPTCAVATDQRGVTRPQGARCDMGAYELACGNGTVDTDIGETCDDGNRVDGDCCSSTCSMDANGTACTTNHDNNDCTTGDVCTDGICIDGTTPLTCPACERCIPDGGCFVAPRIDCRQQAAQFGGPLEIVDKTADQLTWTWSKGSATTLADFGDPVGGDTYTLCFFDQSSNDVIWRAATRSGQCGKRSCWKQSTPSTFRYRDVSRSPDGIDTVLLKRGADGKARIFVKAKGANLDLPPLPLTLPARMQLQAENGACWEASYFELGASRNDATQFKGKSFLP